jgi:hypothetical protein
MYAQVSLPGAFSAAETPQSLLFALLIYISGMLFYMGTMLIDRKFSYLILLCLYFTILGNNDKTGLV